jgi:hypothetical protein
MGDKADYLNRLAALESRLLNIVNEVGLDGVLEILESICMDKHSSEAVSLRLEGYWAAASEEIATMRGVLDGIKLFEVQRAAEKETQ